MIIGLERVREGEGGRLSERNGIGVLLDGRGGVGMYSCVGYSLETHSVTCHLRRYCPLTSLYTHK